MKKYRSRKAEANIKKTYRELCSCWGIEIRERMVSTRYGDTHVSICGKEDGQPVVLFHGVGDDSALMWIYNAAALGKHFRLYAIDTIGGPGLSEIDERYHKTFQDVLWIDDLLEGLSLQKVSLIGVSHGGYMAQLYTLERYEKILKAICISAAVPIGESGNPMKTMMKIFLPEALFPTDRNTQKLLVKLTGKNQEVFTANPLILEHFKWLLRGFNNMAMTNHIIRPFTIEEIEKIKEKVYYLAGKEDPFMKLGGMVAFDRVDVNVQFFDDAGHGLNHELADEINSRIIQLLIN